MSDVTRMLSAIDQGDPEASAELLPLVYDELRRLAARELRRESAGHTLQPTALVHEAYVRLVDQQNEPRWNHRGHFYAAAAESMRRILVESARRKQALKRGGDRERVPLTEEKVIAPQQDPDLIALDAALVRLAVDRTLYLCLGQEHKFEFRPLLRAGISDSELLDAARSAIALKPERHEFLEKPQQVVRFMAKTGG